MAEMVKRLLPWIPSLPFMCTLVIIAQLSLTLSSMSVYAKAIKGKNTTQATSEANNPEVQIVPIAEVSHGSTSYKNDIFPDRNCTGQGSDADSCEKLIDHTWKGHIIIGCTIAVGVEIFALVLIVLYWQQIKWTLRKLSCDCSCTSSTGPEEDHEPMERAAASQAGSSQSSSRRTSEELPVNQTVQTFSCLQTIGVTEQRAESPQPGTSQAYDPHHPPYIENDYEYAFNYG